MQHAFVKTWSQPASYKESSSSLTQRYRFSIAVAWIRGTFTSLRGAGAAEAIAGATSVKVPSTAAAIIRLRRAGWHGARGWRRDKLWLIWSRAAALAKCLMTALRSPGPKSFVIQYRVPGHPQGIWLAESLPDVSAEKIHFVNEINPPRVPGNTRSPLRTGFVRGVAAKQPAKLRGEKNVVSHQSAGAAK